MINDKELTFLLKEVGRGGDENLSWDIFKGFVCFLPKVVMHFL